jgi:hypothetical protein
VFVLLALLQLLSLVNLMTLGSLSLYVKGKLLSNKLKNKKTHYSVMSKLVGTIYVGVEM